MKDLIIEEIAQSIADRFMEPYLNAEILGEKRIYLEVINNTVAIEDNRNSSLVSWLDFLNCWRTGDSAISKLDQLWRRPLEKNLCWFFEENYRDIGLELINCLAEHCVGTIKVATSPAYLCITVQR